MVQKPSDHGQVAVSKIAQAIANSDRIAFFTGAGISAESGLPTYRGIGGLYNDMAVDEGLPIEEILSGPMFERRPELTWKYIAEIEKACRGATANDAHRAIAEIERFAHVTVVTQNVDGFHTDAGSNCVIEMHGNLRTLFCVDCRRHTRVSDYASLDIPPRCEVCAGLIRPNVVLFEEMLPDDAIKEYNHALSQGFDLIFAVGTTAGFPYIYEPIMAAARANIPTVEINPDRTIISDHVEYRLRSGALDSLSAILSSLTTLP